MPSDCVHHFLIPPPRGEALTIGVCRKCNTKRDMDNTVPEGQFNVSAQHRRRAAEGRRRAMRNKRE